MMIDKRSPVIRRRDAWRAAAATAHRASLAGPPACRQGFVLTHAQAHGCGLDAVDLRRLTRRGEFSVPRRGVLSVLPRPDGSRVPHGLRPEIRACATALVRRDAVVSHECAAMAHGVDVLRPAARATLTTCGRRFAGERADAVIHAAWLDDADLTTWFGVPVTTCARTVVDIARTGLRPGIVAVESALCWGATTHHELEETIARQHHWDGVITARRVLELAGDGSESPLESLTRLFLVDCRLPLPTQQVEIDTFLGTFRVDGLWEESGVVLECDGLLKYRVDPSSDVDPLASEKLRQEAVEAEGHPVVRVTWNDIHRWPERTAFRIRRVLGRHAVP